MKTGIEILCTDNHGANIPWIMAERLLDAGWEGFEHEHVKDCSDKDNEFYWESWSHILDHASFTDDNGNVWYLSQDGDLFAFCEELMSQDEKDNFFGAFEDF